MNFESTSSNMRSTMADIARECGVTKMTVSRVLAGGAKVKASTRDRVLAAAGRMNYEVNALAQNLTQNRSGFIGVATPFEGLLGTGYFYEAIRGFSEVLDDAELDFALFDTKKGSFNDGIKLTRLYRQRRVDGLLIVAAHTDDRFLDTLGPAGVPMVIVGERPRLEGVSSIYCDDGQGIQLVCEHLYGLGHRRIAFVEGPRDLATSIRRSEAYRAFCRKHGLENPADYIQPGNFSIWGGRDAGRKLLSATTRPTAIIAANDRTAVGVHESACELGLRVPEDLSITGFDDIYDFGQSFLPLTTIHQPVYEMAKRGAEILLESIDTDTAPTAQAMMDVSLVVRGSTAVPCE